MTHIARSLPGQRRFAPFPITVIKDLDTPLDRRSPATKSDIHKMLDSCGVDSIRGIETRDDLFTYDQATQDSAGVFLIGELERLDQRLHMPLAAVTWHNDIDLREDVAISDEFSSYTNSAFAQGGGIAGSYKNWIGKNSIAIEGPGVDIGKTINPLTLWGATLAWTLPELASAQALGRPVDTQKYEAMQLKYQLDMDEQVYMGDAALGFGGMLNHALMTNTGNNASGTKWSSATPAQILGDVNDILQSIIGAAGQAMVPNEMRLSWPDFGLLTSTLISTAGNISILRFLLQNNIVVATGQGLNIQPRKWLLGTGNSFGGFSGMGPAPTNALYAYRKEESRIRIPVVPLLRTPLQYDGIYQKTTYYGRIGVVENVYPELTALRTGIN